MKAVVHVMLKREVLDPQGQAIGHAAAQLGYTGIVDVRQGKRFEIALDPSLDRAGAEALLAELAEKLLANPVIEDFAVASIEA